MGITRGLEAVKALSEQEAEAEAMAQYQNEENVFAAEVNEYIKEMTDLGVPGEWHYQMFGGWEGNEFDYRVVLFDPNNRMDRVVGQEETPYKAWMDAEWEVNEGDYPFTWDELSESTRKHTEAWTELEKG